MTPETATPSDLLISSTQGPSTTGPGYRVIRRRDLGVDIDGDIVNCKFTQGALQSIAVQRSPLRILHIARVGEGQ